jgi:hypothetical protein
MYSATTRRSLAVLTFGLLGALMAFVVGARIGAAIDGQVKGVTLAHSPMPTIHAQASLPVAAMAKK